MHLVIHGRNVEIPTQLIELAGKRLQYALGRLAHLVGRVNVRIQDENGPRGGVDTNCLAVVQLKTGGSLVIHGRYASAAQAVNVVLDRIAEQVKRQHDRAIESLHGRHHRTA